MDGQRQSALHQLSDMCGLYTAYIDANGRERLASDEQLLAALISYGAPVTGFADVPDALRQVRMERTQRFCEPVTVIHPDEPALLKLCLPAHLSDHLSCWQLKYEEGITLEWTVDLASLPGLNEAIIEGVRYITKFVPLLQEIPLGYHQCHIDLSGLTGQMLIIVAPKEAYLPEDEKLHKRWGVFLPLYALRTRYNWGAGDFADLKQLLNWIGSHGGALVGTLPMLPAFLDEPYSISPYSPVSRLFWHEFYLPVEDVPEMQSCKKAQDLVFGTDFQNLLTYLRSTSLVDYKTGMAAKRSCLELLSEHCTQTPTRETALQSWVRANPKVREYARFRAAMEKQRQIWPLWPASMRDGTLGPGDYDLEAEHYHLYVQWLADEQMNSLTKQGAKNKTSLYLDLPLGVHQAGFDVWREKNIFAQGAFCGAPSDQLNSLGQNWEFPPLHPEALRKQGYRYYIEVLRHHMRHAGILRIDHIMGLHRLFWIPKGLTASDGVYVKYFAKEFYAILALESHRHKTLLVGEDLGTVPETVRSAMKKHKVYRMYIVPFEINSWGSLRRVPARSLAALNTHDMPPFAKYWHQTDRSSKLSISHYLFRRKAISSPSLRPKRVLRGLYKTLAESRAGVMLVNLEDIWLETAEQNVPGTTDENPNWRRKTAWTMEQFVKMPATRQTLREINKFRNYTIPR